MKMVKLLAVVTVVLMGLAVVASAADYERVQVCTGGNCQTYLVPSQVPSYQPVSLTSQPRIPPQAPAAWDNVNPYIENPHWPWPAAGVATETCTTCGTTSAPVAYSYPVQAYYGCNGTTTFGAGCSGSGMSTGRRGLSGGRGGLFRRLRGGCGG